jgi:hypothetical protein
MPKSFPDLTGDGEVTRADVLKARGVFRRGGRIKKMGVGGMSADTEADLQALKTLKQPDSSSTKSRSGMSADTEADLQALKTLKQGDYSTGGPKRRYPRGKVKRYADEGYKHGGKVQKYAGGGSVKSSASRRADGIAQRGKTRGRVI